MMIALCTIGRLDDVKGDTLTLEDGKEIFTITKQAARECIDRYLQMILFLMDWDHEIFIMSLADYKRLPAIVHDYRQVYLKWKADLQKDKHK